MPFIQEVVSVPRPSKRRRICAEPSRCGFGPRAEFAREEPCIVMTLDEYETIRLIDLEGLTQEECAQQMCVARTTAQAIYGSARQKLARSLVEGWNLRIEGGDYELCDGQDQGCRQRSRSGRRCCENNHPDGAEPSLKNKEAHMKIAVTYENGQIFQHFGHTEQFKLYTVEDNRIVDMQVIDTNGSGHGALATFLIAHGADMLICGGIGGGARMALAQAGIRLFAGVAGDADKAVEALLGGNLVFSENATCDHHDHHHGEGHDCGSHGDGHSCGSHGEGHECGQHGCGSHRCGE